MSDELPDDADFDFHSSSTNVATDVFMALSGQGLPVRDTHMDHDGTTLAIEFNDEADGLRLDVQLESALFGLSNMGGYRMWLAHLTMMIVSRFQELSPYTQQRRKLRMDEEQAIASIMRSAKKP